MEDRRTHRERLQHTSVDSFPTAGSQRTLRILDWDYVYDSGLLERFERRHNAVVEVETIANSAGVIDRLNTEPTPDIAALGNYAVPQAIDEGLIKPVDTGRIGGYESVFDELKREYFEQNGRVYAVPRSFGQTPLCYRSDRISGELSSWSALWDGTVDRVMLRNDAQLALLYASVDEDFSVAAPLDELTDAELNEVFTTMLRQTDYLWETADESQAAFRRLAAVEGGPVWRFAALQLQRKGVPVQVVRPREGTKAWFIQFVRPTGSTSDDLAQSFIETWYDWLGWGTLMQPLGIAIPSRDVFDRYDADLTAYGLNEFDNFIQQPPLSSATVGQCRRAWEDAKAAVGSDDE